MKTTNLILTALLSGTLLLGGCLHDEATDEEKAELAALLAGYVPETSEETSKQDQLDGEYITTTDVTDDAATGGTASIGGEITPDSVSRKLLAKMAYGRSVSKARLLSRALDAPGNADFTVSYITGSGTVKTLNNNDLNIQVRLFEGNIQFVISGLGDAINYIIEVAVSVDGVDQQPLKSVAFIPKDATQAPKVEMDSVSTVVAEAVTQKVKNGFFETGGKTFSQDYIKDLSDTMTAVIAEVILENPTDFNVEQFNQALDEGGVDALVSKLFSEPTVSESVNDLENTAVAVSKAPPTTLQDNEAGRAEGREVIDELFAQFDGEQGDGDEDSTPSIIINFFGDKFAEGETNHKSIETIINVIFAGVDFSENRDLATELGLSKEGALEGFKTKLATIFTDIENIISVEDQATLTEGDVMALAAARERNAEVPDIILALFPAKDRTIWAALTDESIFTVPQAISLVFYVLDDYLGDLKGFERNDDGQIEETDGVNFNPDFLLGEYGFDPTSAAQQDLYASLDVNWLEVQPGRTWINSLNNGEGGEIDILSLFTCVDSYPEGVFDVASVSVTYPTASGTETIQLKNESDFYGNGGEEGGSSCFTVNPWAESDLLSQDSEFRDEQDNIRWDDVWNRLLSTGKLVTDFESGQYLVTVVYSKDNVAQENLVEDFSKTIITGLQNLTPRFTSPNGLPRFPDPGASPAEWEAFDTAQSAFSMTTFPDTNSVFFTWSEPEGLADILAELSTETLSVIAVYNLDVGRDLCGDDPDTAEVEDYCRWEHIFSSWELGGQIQGTSFELPDEIKDKLEVLELTDTPYQAGLNISFIDEHTGHYLGEGGWTGAPFRIGAELNFDDTFTLTGSVNNVPDNLSAADLAMYKVAMILESCQEDEFGQAEQFTYEDENGVTVTETFFPWVCTSETLAISGLTADATTGNYGYSLAPTLREAMSNTNNAWLDIRLFIDADADGIVDQGDANSQPEAQFWSQDGVHFNAWGGVLRLNKNNCDENFTNCNFSEEIVLPNQSYVGPSFDVNQGDCCGGPGDGDDDFQFEGLNNELTPGATFTDSVLSWSVDSTILDPANISAYLVILVELDASTLGAGDPTLISVLAAEVETSVSSVTMADMLSGGTGVTNVTSDVVTHAANDTDDPQTLAPITELSSIVNSKAYYWFVEALDANGDRLAESEGFPLGTANQGQPPAANP